MTIRLRNQHLWGLAAIFACGLVACKKNPGGGTDLSRVCPGYGDATPQADDAVGVCTAALKVCDEELGWVEPDYTQIAGYEADELSCDGVDNDCDGAADEGLSSTYFADVDGDGYGDPGAAQESCSASAPAGQVANSSDCDDGNPAIHPDAVEVCDGSDNNCDAVVDAGNCDPNAACDDSGGVAACLCDGGYWGDGVSCERIVWDALGHGEDHACGIRHGALYCWGENADGQLGNPLQPTTDPTYIPQLVGNFMDWEQVDGGEDHNCAIRGGGLLYCWGDNGEGQLGLGFNWGQLNGCTDDATAFVFECNQPHQVGSETDWSLVSAGKDHVCAIRGAGELYCWGQNSDGQLGQGTASTTDASAPLRVGAAADWETVSANDDFSCGIRAGQLYCWGANFDLQTGTADATPEVWTPTQVGSDSTWTHVSTGGDHACGINAGELFCWGRNGDGQLGQGTASTTDASAPLRVGAAADWTAIASANDEDHNCGLRGAGALYCWGQNDNWQLGLGPDWGLAADCVDDATNNDFYCTTPQLVDVGPWDLVTAGEDFVCGTQVGDLFCWGHNNDGQSQHPWAATPAPEDATDLPLMTYLN